MKEMDDTSEVELRECTWRKKKMNKESVGRDDGAIACCVKQGRNSREEFQSVQRKVVRLDPWEVTGEHWAGIFHRVWGRSQQRQMLGGRCKSIFQRTEVRVLLKTKKIKDLRDIRNPHHVRWAYQKN